MDDKEQRKIFAQNLRYQISLKGKTQKEVALAVGTTKNSVNNWCNAISMPTAGKIQTLADYFGIRKSQLLDLQSDDASLQLSKLEEEVIKQFRISPHKDAIISLLGLSKNED